MRRTQGIDANTVREDAAHSRTDLGAQLLVADLDMLGGHVDDAFTRLLDHLRGRTQETKARSVTVCSSCSRWPARRSARARRPQAPGEPPLLISHCLIVDSSRPACLIMQC